MRAKRRGSQGLLMMAALLPLVIEGCFLNSQGTGCPTIDADFEGCFEHRDGREMGWLVITQLDCNMIDGHGRGLWPLADPDDVWAFSGSVFEAGNLVFRDGYRGHLGEADLMVAWESPAGDWAENRIFAAHRRLDSEETLLVELLGWTDLEPTVELVRCPPGE